MIRICLFLIPLLLLVRPAQAMKFSTSFTEFELPAGWACQLDDLTWTCEAKDESIQGDAVIVLAAKRKGEADTLAGINMYLLKPREIKNEKGATALSKPSYVRNTEINGHTWVDSLHVDSELSGYLTRYIATVRGDIEVLITYSIDKNRYEVNTPMFEALIRSVKIFAPHENTPPPAPKLAAAPQVLAPGINSPMTKFPGGDMKAATDAPVAKVKKTDDGGGGGLLWLLLIGGAGFYFYKKKKKEREEGN